MIYFKDEFGIYRVCGYDAILEKETFSTLINRLGEEIESDKQRANLLSKTPKFIIKFLLLSEKYYRIRQFIYKNYTNAEDGSYVENFERLYNL